ncbi:MAG: hypothetical protein Q8P84_09340 [Deltaproteobacteria bacterium]|nr:hypothetical protein [Deltaproteobacteria bacterium]
MTELNRPIRPYGGEASHEREPEESPFAMDLHGGLAGNLRTPVSESGSGQQLGVSFYNCPNTRDCYGLGFQLNFAGNNGSEYYDPTIHFGGALSILKKAQKWPFRLSGKETVTFAKENRQSIGLGKTGEAGTIDIGNDLSFEGSIKAGDRFTLSAAPYFGTLNTLPTDSIQTENIPVLSLQVGVRFKLAYTDLALTPPPDGITDYDIAHFWISGAHRLASGYATAEALAGPSAQASEYTAEMFGESAGGSSQKLEGLPSLTVINTITGLGGDRMNTVLKGKGDQRGWLIGAEAASALGAFALSVNDESNTMLTQGMTATLELAGVGIGYGMDIHGAETARNFLLYRSLVNGAAFMLGFALSDSKAGGAILSGGQQALMAGMFSPDPAETGLVSGGSHLLAYEHYFGNDSNLIGYQNIQHLTSAPLYTNTGVFLQTSPVVNEEIQEGLDAVTARDAGIQGAKAKMTAGLGLEVQTGPAIWSAGAHSALLLRESGAPQPGQGLHQRMLLSFGDKTRFEMGVQFAEEFFGEDFQVSVTPLAGARF